MREDFGQYVSSRFQRGQLTKSKYREQIIEGQTGLKCQRNIYFSQDAAKSSKAWPVTRKTVHSSIGFAPKRL